MKIDLSDISERSDENDTSLQNILVNKNKEKKIFNDKQDDEDILYLNEDELKVKSKIKLTNELNTLGLTENFVKIISNEFGDQKYSVIDAEIILLNILSGDKTIQDLNINLLINYIINVLFEWKYTAIDKTKIKIIYELTNIN